MSVTLNNGDIYGALINGSLTQILLEENCFMQVLAALQNEGDMLTQEMMTQYLQNMPQDTVLRIEHQALDGLDDYRIYLGEQNIGILSKTNSNQYYFSYSSTTSTDNNLFLNISCLVI